MLQKWINKLKKKKDILSETKSYSLQNVASYVNAYFFPSKKVFFETDWEVMVWDTDKTHTVTGEERMFKMTVSGTVSIPVFVYSCFNRLNWSLQNVNMLMRWTDETQGKGGERGKTSFLRGLSLIFILFSYFIPLPWSLFDLLLIQICQYPSACYKYVLQ